LNRRKKRAFPTDEDEPTLKLAKIGKRRKTAKDGGSAAERRPGNKEADFGKKRKK
jgi:hypothetical protein